jgi:cytochrome b
MRAAVTVRVWDPVVRVIHWSVASLIVVDMMNEAGANPWHRYFGYAAAALVLARLAWGVVGTYYARLSLVAKSARSVGKYVAALTVPSKAPLYVAHNPLGACMVLLMWTLILVTVVTGWMQQLDAFWGDENVEAVHGAVSYILAGCALLHVTGVLVTGAIHRINLVKAMITGRKTLPDPDHAREA